MNKVASVTLAVWIMKICATTLRETAGGLVSMTLNVGHAASSALLLFVIALAWQLSADSFRPNRYWTVILATGTAGTTVSVFMDRALGLGCATGSAILAVLLGVVLLAW